MVANSPGVEIGKVPAMRRALVCCFVGMLGSLLLSPAASAGTRNPSDYPLRVHIFEFNGYSHYYRSGSTTNSLDNVDGEGRANLYENSDPHAFDFSYSCSHRLMVSPGFETYLARWKKPDRELELLLPVLGGKPGETNSCDLKVNLKPDSAYSRHNGPLTEGPASEFKAWMVKYQYDPEHGKNEPIRPAQPTQTSNAAKAAPSASSGSNAQ
jgi:hypothetical protein